MQQAYRMVAAAIGWFALVLQYVLIVKYKTDGDLIAAAIRFLSFFTLLSNVLVALAMTLPWLAPDTQLGRFFLEPAVRTAILAYIIIVAVIYHVLLAQAVGSARLGIRRRHHRACRGAHALCHRLVAVRAERHAQIQVGLRLAAVSPGLRRLQPDPRRR